MPRSRDLILFILCVLFLLGAILFTVACSGGTFAPVHFSDEPTPTVELVIREPVENIDRPGTVARLKEKIGDFLQNSDVQPSVTEPVEIEIASSTEVEVAPVTDEVTLVHCVGAVDGLRVAASWPREGVTISNSGSVRNVSYTEATGLVVSLLEMPLYPVPNASPACLDSEIVGVTTGGSLIFNTDAISYDMTGSETLIGYARDGFPIYGQYTGETDSCGGYQSSSGYRYGLSKERTFMLGCFTGAPNSF